MVNGKSQFAKNGAPIQTGLPDGILIMLTGVYTIYLLTSAMLTIWVARTLSRCGRPFLIQVFHGNQVLADSVNHLLVVGFYLVNAGLIGIALRETISIADLKQAVELLSFKLGRTLAILGIMHFINLITFCWLRDYKSGLFV